MMSRPGRTPTTLTATIVVLFGLLTADVCTGQNAFFDEGNQLYQAGDFEAALERYAQILDDGLESGELYYNIGNTYFKLGELGPAILYYERARRLMPSDDDLLANLELARSLTVDQVAPLPGFWLFRVVGWWVALLPRSALGWLVALAYLTAMTAIVVVILRPGTALAVWGRRLAITGATVTVVFGLNLAVRELGVGAAEEAVIMVEETEVQSAPSEDSALQIFAVHEGTKVRIDRRSDLWIEIVLEDGKVGWVRADQLEPI
jgi:tetratricopeptide (TPR) repeat protein